MRLASMRKWRDGMITAALAWSALGGGEYATAAGRDNDTCVQQWLPGFGLLGLNASAYALTRWDPDGSGREPAQVVAGGNFTLAGGVATNRIARWGGRTWQPFGSGMNGTVLALTTWDPDGNGPQPHQVVAGGIFTTAGGVMTNFVARWDGRAWLPLGTGTNNWVLALTTWDPDGSGPQRVQLVVGGRFTTAGDVRANYIAGWDGGTWQPFGTGMSGGSFPYVHAITTWDADGDGPQPARLVAGGEFTSAGGIAASRIAHWDGRGWQPLDSGINGTVYALASWDPDASGPEPAQLVAGGYFTAAGGILMNHITSWDGRAWQSLGSGMTGPLGLISVRALTSWDPDGSGPVPARLVAGGDIRTAGGISTNNIARWDGSAWEPIGSGLNSTVFAVMSWESDGVASQPPSLVAGRQFATISGGTADGIARTNHTTWQSFGLGLNSSVEALTNWNPNGNGAPPDLVVAAGSFTSAGGLPANRIARWDGSVWESLGEGMNANVLALTTWVPDEPGLEPVRLVAGGSFTTAGGVTANRIAHWNGSVWQPFGAGMNANVITLMTWDPDAGGPLSAQLVAGGLFTTAGGVSANHVALWNGMTWQPLGAGVNGGVRALIAWDPDRRGPEPAQLVAGGQFTSADDVTANHIARWDGQRWLPLGMGMNDWVFTLSTWDSDGSGPEPEQLVAGGSYTSAGGVAANRIASWNGSAWQPLGSGMNNTVRVVANWDPDRSGPQPAQLVAGGNFTTADGVITNFISRWNGNTWEPIGTGLSGGGSPYVYALTTLDLDGSGPLPSQLVAGGFFRLAGGLDSSYIAIWGCPEDVVCLRGDTNRDDAIDFRDIDCFVSALVSQATWLSCAGGLDAATYICANDCNCNGSVDPDDIDCFVQCLVAGECPPCL